jgi:hypothetical protein
MRSALVTRARSHATYAREQLRRVRRRQFGIYARLTSLEEEVQENRQLNRRIAELTDVVAELLLPVADRDEARVREVLAEYRADM